MIKLIDILNESKRVKLDPDFKKVLNNVVDIIFKKRLRGFKKYTPITSIPIEIADGTPGTVEIVVDPELPYYGILDTKVEDSTDPNDFIIKINPKEVKSKKGLYQTLYHEIMHATDPMFSTKSTESFWDTYDPEYDEKYWGHPVEFRAITNEFIEGLINEFSFRRKRLKNLSSIKTLEKSLDNILNHFSTGEKLIPLSNDIIDDMYGSEEMTRSRKLLNDILVDYPEISDLMKSANKKLNYLTVLELVKEYSGDNWKNFLTMLYKASEEIREIINQDSI
jgi:hypothetical protein